MKKYIFITDCHFPYEDKRAWKLLLKTIKTIRPYGIVILGDFFDFYAVSSHSKDPNRSRDLEWEIAQGNKALRQLDAFKFVKDKRFIAGNHENRAERYLQEKAPELFNMVKLPELFKLKENGWQYIPYKDHTRVGKIYITHDVGTVGKTAHMDALRAFQDNVIIAHTHRTGYIVEGNAKGVPHVGAMFGWLGCVKQVDYMNKIKASRDWSLGFGLGYLMPSGNMHINPVTIIDYSVVADGKLIK